MGSALGVTLRTDIRAAGPGLDSFVGLAVRRNARRTVLMVSDVLGKHIPTDPRVVHGAGLELGALVAAVLDPATSPLVVGFAETATALGHSVAEALGATYIHSTRRLPQDPADVAGVLEFREEHSHATDHALVPDSPALLRGDGPLVLVDDELTTGRTAMNIIAALHAHLSDGRSTPRLHYVVAALVDVRDQAARETLASFALSLGIRVDVVASVTGALVIAEPASLVARGAALIATIPAPAASPPEATPVAVPVAARRFRAVEHGWPVGVREGGRHGFSRGDARALDAAVVAVARSLAPTLGGEDIVVLGHEELMYAPLRLAEALSDTVVASGRLDCTVRFSTTTRSPVLVVDDPGYAIRSSVTFPAHDNPVDGPGPRFAYNLNGIGGGRIRDLVFVVDELADTPLLDAPGGAIEALGAVADRVHVIVLPADPPRRNTVLRGPAFGSYPAEDAGWLLTDLSHITLEAATEDREAAIQSGAAHYAESLPIEYEPGDAYLTLFRTALAEGATRVAHDVGVLTELVLAERGRDVVLVSLARAGTPVGVLMRRWAAQQHGVDLPHYAISIVRDRGIDLSALQWLAERYESTRIVFVDGWTGKGAITRELQAAVADANQRLGTAFDPDLAVLADPGWCARTYGTRADYLIPTACLNSTVSGLVSRTVLNEDLLAPWQFHGAKFYAHLRDADLSGQVLDVIGSRFAEVAGGVASSWRTVADSDRTPTWAGWAEVEKIAAEYGIDNINLVKPGVGETTRVLLRRVPWRILLSAQAGGDVEHVRLLAEQRGVAVDTVSGLTFNCIGLIQQSGRESA